MNAFCPDFKVTPKRAALGDLCSEVLDLLISSVARRTLSGAMRRADSDCS